MAVADLGGHGRLNGLLDPEAGQTLLAALEPLARPSGANDARSVGSDAPMPSPNWPAAAWRAASSPRPAGSDPELLVTVDLDSLLGPGGLGGGSAGRGRWRRRRAGGWPVTGR